MTGSPHLRFYAGVPLITKRGIPIGSLFVVDDRVGSGFESEKIHFMATMANTIISHMEMIREIEEHRRGMKMSRGLASFVEGKSNHPPQFNHHPHFNYPPQFGHSPQISYSHKSIIS